ncbi:hypothetical protein X474_23065 [Dethiosulfatarculus sandiegensis]|uniref:Uncharacterized protein n=1 Tax=Dethiosulfatarculus sandiegensis TaxID=1429043 RepID=A0A0D2J7H9_9BACT|nr:hypothetical protein X474_23065 [Dethiosulfatarculus sandiegensis]
METEKIKYDHICQESADRKGHADCHGALLARVEDVSCK